MRPEMLGQLRVSLVWWEEGVVEMLNLGLGLNGAERPSLTVHLEMESLHRSLEDFSSGRRICPVEAKYSWMSRCYLTGRRSCGFVMLLFHLKT